MQMREDILLTAVFILAGRLIIVIALLAYHLLHTEMPYMVSFSLMMTYT